MTNLKIKFSVATKRGSLAVARPGVFADDMRHFGSPEDLFRSALMDCCASTAAELTWNGLESFAVTTCSPALVLEVLEQIPAVYAGTFTRLDPPYGSPVTRPQCIEAVQVVQEAAADFGTDVHAQAEEIRVGIIDTPDKLANIAQILAGETELAVDLETFPLEPAEFKKREIGDTRKSGVRLLSIATRACASYLVDCVALDHNLEPLRGVLESADIIGHNLQYDWAFLLDKYGIELGKRRSGASAGRLWDTLIAARVLSNEAPLVVFESKYRGIVETMSEWMIDPVELPEDEDDEEDAERIKPREKKRIVFKGDPERVSNSLNFVLTRFLDVDCGPDMSGSNWGCSRLSDRQLIYAGGDVLLLFALRDAMLATADADDRLIINLDMQTLRICLNIYKQGLPIDLELLAQKLEARRQALLEARREAYIVLPEVDFSSPKDCVKALGENGIFVESVDKTDLMHLQENPIVKPLLRVRALLAEVRDLELKILAHLRDDGAIHGTILSSGAGTGRCSSKMPNLQNVKRVPDERTLALDSGTTNFRELVRAPDGWQVLVADYNQMELRGAAVAAQEPTMLAEYKKAGADLHKATARGLASDFDSLSEREQKEARRKAKASNFGLVYGMQVHGFRITRRPTTTCN